MGTPKISGTHIWGGFPAEGGLAGAWLTACIGHGFAMAGPGPGQWEPGTY